MAEIEAAAQRAADLTKQLLTFSRRQPLRPVPVDLNDLVRGLMKMLRRLLPESIDIDSVPGHDLPSVNADPGQLEQVIVNLCVNARDAMERGGRLTIETENVLISARYCESHPWAKPGRYVLLSVTDTGVGMSPEAIQKLFLLGTKHSTLGTAKEKGTGLGLLLCKEFIEKNGGTIHVESKEGVGSKFYFTVPKVS